jgi:hypothetical protein
MVFNIFQILAFALYFSCSLARNSHSALLKRNLSLANRSAHNRESPVEMTKRDGTKYVFMHHVSSVQYPLQVYI